VPPIGHLYKDIILIYPKLARTDDVPGAWRNLRQHTFALARPSPQVEIGMRANPRCIVIICPTRTTIAEFAEPFLRLVEEPLCLGPPYLKIGASLIIVPHKNYIRDIRKCESAQDGDAEHKACSNAKTLQKTPQDFKIEALSATSFDCVP
jgi:hypothetical protein